MSVEDIWYMAVSLYSEKKYKAQHRHTGSVRGLHENSWPNAHQNATKNMLQPSKHLRG
jgi:hypothetical protein